MRASRFLALFLIALSALRCGAQVHNRRPAAKSDWIMYAGTYTRPPSKGIYAYRFQPATGTFTSGTRTPATSLNVASSAET